MSRTEMPRIDPMQAELSAELRRAKRQARLDAVRASVHVAQDCPLLPTPDERATPHVAEEPGDNLTPQQRLAVAAIVGGETFTAAARLAGCGRRTLFLWRRQPAFARAVETRSREALDVVVVRVRNLMLRATRVLGDSMLDPNPDVAPRSAFRVLNSARLWTVIERPAAEEADGDGDAPDAPDASGVAVADVVPGVAVADVASNDAGA